MSEKKKKYAVETVTTEEYEYLVFFDVPAQGNVMRVGDKIDKANYNAVCEQVRARKAQIVYSNLEYPGSPKLVNTAQCVAIYPVRELKKTASDILVTREMPNPKPLH